MSVNFTALTTPSGTGVCLKCWDNLGNPQGIVTLATTGTMPSYVITPSGGSPGSPVTMSGTWIWELGRPWAFFFFDSPTFLASDSVAITLPSGFMTVGNPTVVAMPAATVTATNTFGGTLLPAFDAGAKTMPVGYNVQPEDYFGESLVFSDMSARLSYVGHRDIAAGTVVTFDSNGYPLTGNAATVNATVTQPSTPVGTTDPTVNQEGIDNKGNLNTPNGLYVCYYDGPFNGVTFSPDNNTAMTEVTELQVNTGTTGNRRVFNFQANTSVQYSPKFFATLNGTGPVGGVYTFSTTNIHIYPPDPSDPTGMTAWLPGGGTARGSYPKFHPSYPPKIAGAKSLRFVESMGGLQNTWSSSSQIRTDTQLGRSAGPPTYVTGGAMINIQAYTGAPVSSPLNIQIQITTNGPHGFFPGLPLTFSGGTDTATFSDGSTLAFTGPNNPVTSVIDDVNFTMSAIRAAPGTSGVHMTNTIGNGSYCGLVNAEIGTGFALSDVTDLCNLNGSDCYFNFPASVADEAVTYVANYLATHLNPGLKLYVEFANEVWNDQAAPSNTVLATFQFQKYGGGTRYVDDYHVYYVFRMGQVHALCLAAYTAAGRATTDIIRVMGLNNVNPGDTTDQLLPAFQLLGSDAPNFDCGAIAVYYGGMDVQDYRSDIPGLTTLTVAIVDTLSVDQLMDLLEFSIVNTDISTASTTTLQAAFGKPTISYEGGPELLIPGLGRGGPAAFTDPYHRQHAIHRHPRMFGVERQAIQQFQNSGLLIHHDLYVTGGSGLPAYSAYEYYNQPEGTGTNTENPVPEAMDSVVSQVGGAIKSWNLLVATTPTVSPASTSVAVGQTMQFGATGFTGGSVTWSSEADGIATVNTSSGLATGVAVGTVNITATGVANTGEIASGVLQVTTAPEAPTTATVTGPATVSAGVTSGVYTVTLNTEVVSGTLDFVPSSSGFSLTSATPNPVVFNVGDSVKTFVVLPATAGTGTVGGSAEGLTVTPRSVTSSPSLSLSPTTATAVNGASVALTMTLIGSTETIAATASNGGELSTNIPTSGVVFDCVVPSSGSGQVVVSVGDGKALSAACTINFGPAPSGIVAVALRYFPILRRFRF